MMNDATPNLAPLHDAAEQALLPPHRVAPTASINGVASLSPSLLWPTSTTASYELKFLLSRARAEQVEGWARQHLALDPHAEPALGDAYRVRSIYFDTEHFDVFHQSPSYKRRKFRLRRYGDEPGVYLESKAKSADKVAKRRTLVAMPE